MTEGSVGVRLARSVVLLVACAAFVACSDDKASAPASSESTTPPTTPLADGTISVSVRAITGQQGKALVVMVIAAADGPVASACVQIGSASLVVNPIVLTEAGPNGEGPCTGSTTPKVFAAGTYTVTAGIFVPPATSPEKSVTQTVQITGPGVAVELDGSALST